MQIKIDQLAYRNLPDVENYTLFSQPYWFDAMVGSAHWSAVLFYNQNQEIVAAWPFIRKKKWGLEIWTSSEYSAYGDIVKVGHKEEKLSLSILEQQLPLFTLFEFCHREPDWISTPFLSRRQYQRIPVQNQIDHYWSRLQARKRNMLRRVLEEIHFEKTQNPSEIILGIQGSFDRQEIPLIEESVLRQWFDQLPRIWAWLAKDEARQILGAVVAIAHGDTLYAVLGGRGSALGPKGIMEGLYWQMIEWAHQHQWSIDLCGSNIPGVAHFNRRMGAEQYSMVQYQGGQPRGLNKIVNYWRRYRNNRVRKKSKSPFTS